MTKLSRSILGKLNMSKLMQLPDGTWVRPEVVESIQAMDEGETYSGGFVAPRVVVQLNERYIVHETPTFNDACRLREQLAAKVMEKL